MKYKKLTLKAAKAIAVQEFGTSAGLKPHENNDHEYQRYEMRIGKYNAAIANSKRHPGIAYVSFVGDYTYYDINTCGENIEVTEKERHKYQLETIRDMAATHSSYMIKAIIDEHGDDYCLQLFQNIAYLEG